MPKMNAKAPKPAPTDEPPPVPAWLDDGFPNPAAFPNSDQGFEEFQNAITEKDLWGEYIGSLYRVAPRRLPTDKEANVCQFVSPLTIAAIKKKYGGKKWTVFLNRLVNGRQRLAKKFQFDIEAKPIWQDDETAEPAETTGRSADGTAVLVGLVKDLVKARDQAASEGKEWNPDAAIGKSIEIMSKGSNAALDMIASQAAAAGKGNNELTTMLLKALIDKTDSNPQGQIVEKLIERAFAAPPNPLDQIKGWLEISDRIGNRGSPGGGADWSGVFEKLIDRGPSLLEQGRQLLAEASALNRQNPAAAPARKLGPTPVPSATPATAAAPATATSTSPPGPPTDEQIGEYNRRVIRTHLKATIVGMALHSEDGSTAAEMVDLMDHEFAEELATMLRDDPQSLSIDPILKEVRQAPNLQQFIAGFLEYFEPEEEPADSAAEPAGAPN